jgi:1-acyl-sn-glycerol-3-phosphate acyltransferase
MKTLEGIFGLIWKLYFLVVFSFFAILFYPFFLAILIREEWNKYGFNLYIAWSWMLRFFCFYRIKVFGQDEKIPEGPYIIIANHTSYLDVFFMYSILPKHPFAFLGKAEVLKYPIVGTYFRSLNIPVYRKDKTKAGKSYLLASKAVEKGWSLAIFPEGGIPDGENCPKMLPFKDGAFKLAKSLNIPILPLSFTNNYKLFSDPTETFGPARPGTVRVHIHPAIPVEKIQSMEIAELRQMSFDIINAPILEEHPELRHDLETELSV